MAARRYEGLAAAWEKKGDAARAAELRARAAALGAR